MNSHYRKISRNEIREFNRLFGLLTVSKIPVIDSVELIYSQTVNNQFKTVLKEIITSLKSGKSLSQSFKKHNNLFSEIYIANLVVAEETGNLSEVLIDYNKFDEKFQDLSNKISQAARYPLFVILVALAVISFMLFFLIPTLESLFISSNSEIPGITSFLLSLSQLISENIIFICIGFLLFVLGAYKLITNKSFTQNFLDKFLINLPFISAIYKKNILARFSLSMNILLKNRVKLVDALKFSKNTTKNSVFRDEINHLVKDLIKGNKFSQRLKKSSFFDHTFIKLLSAGEESAELEQVFSLIGEFYTKEFDNQIKKITALIEPVLILLVGIIVGIILIAMYLPMFELMNHMGM